MKEKEVAKIEMEAIVEAIFLTLHCLNDYGTIKEPCYHFFWWIIPLPIGVHNMVCVVYSHLGDLLQSFRGGSHGHTNPWSTIAQ